MCLTSISQRWSEPELKPLVSESSGLLERESKKELESRRFAMRAMLGNFSKKSAVMLMDSGGRYPGGFPRMLLKGLFSIPSTGGEQDNHIILTDGTCFTVICESNMAILALSLFQSVFQVDEQAEENVHECVQNIQLISIVRRHAELQLKKKIFLHIQ